MPTQLLSIISTIGQWQFVTITGEQIKCPPISQQNPKPASGDLPMRIVSPTINRMQAKSAKPQTLRGGLTFEWEIEDLFLYKPIASSATLAECNHVLVAYIADYSNMYNDHIALSPSITIEDCPLEMGVFEYPRTQQGTGVLYAGVCATLKIKELT